MAKRLVFVPGIGEVNMTKRRGAKYLRLSISASGQVRISLPYWVPYTAAIAFAQQRMPWVKKHIEDNKIPLLVNQARIGKAHRLFFRQDSRFVKTSTKVTLTTIQITSPKQSDDSTTQQAALAASEKALKMEAENLLPIRLSAIAKKHDFNYKGINVRKLTSRWGSCSSSGVITLSYFLIQLPWEFIDYVLLHELMHTRYLNHSQKFWADLNSILPNARSLQKQIRAFRPRVEQL